MTGRPARRRAVVLGALALGLLAAEAPPRGQAVDTARAALDRGLALRGPAALGEAETLFRLAIDLARRDGEGVTEGHARRALGGVLSARGDVAGADAQWAEADTLFSAASDWNALGALHNQRALAAFARGAEGDAERWWLAALGQFEAAGITAERARVLRNLSFLRRLEPAARVALAQQALELVVGTPDQRLEGATRHQLSDLLHLSGDLAGAAAHLEVALPLLEDGDDRVAYARALTSLGRLRRLFGQPAASVDLNRQAAMLLESSGDPGGAAQALDAITRALIDLDDEAGALASATDAVATARHAGQPAILVHTLSRLAVQLAAGGQRAAAVEALDEAGRLGPSAPAAHAAYLDAVASVRHYLGQYEASLAARDEREGLVLTAEDRVWQHANRARTLLALNRRAEARTVLRAAVADLDALTANLVPEDGSKRAYFERTRILIDQHVWVLAQLDDPEAALEASERGRARAFLDLMTSRGVADAAARQAEARAVTAATSIEAVRAAVPSRQPAVLSLDALLLRGRGATSALPPEPVVPSGQVAAVPSLDDIRHTAARLRSHLLVYWVGNDETLIWVVAPDGRVTMTRSPVGRRALTALVTAATPASATPARGDGADRVGFERDSLRALRRLYDLLVAPVRRDLPSGQGALLSIVPHGPLFRVSFAGLQSREGRYLVEDFRLHYAPSAGALAAAPRARRGDEANPVVVVADPESGATDDAAPLARLPGAVAEARAIARSMGPRPVEVLAGREASEARVRQAMPHASVLHFATHGVISDTAPWTSYLALTPGGDSLADDGRLRAAELYDLRLEASMVVLGACRTATGPLTGDGITGLARGFFAAGVPVVVASLWDLPDATTSLMQPAFYRHWQGSASAASALRDAQLDLLRRLRAGRVRVTTPAGPLTLPEHPSLWAGLVVLGAP